MKTEKTVPAITWVFIIAALLLSVIFVMTAGPDLNLLFRITLSLLIVCLFGLCIVCLTKQVQVERTLSFEKIKNRLLLEESGDEQFIYDVKTDIVTFHGSLLHHQISTVPSSLSDVIASISATYPEAASDMERIGEVLHSVIENGNTEVFDRPMSFFGKTRWIRMVFVPYRQEGHVISHVFASMCDTTLLHSEFNRSLEMLKNLPGGFHRCYLSDPIHLEYISDGLCKMLGYSLQEITQLTNGKYSLLIHEQDRAAFYDFVVRLSKKEDILTCEYRMLCKDGRILTVSDIMESIRDSSGIMYGYSAVTDITEKAAQLSEAEELIKKGADREEALLNEQLLLAAAAQNAYSMIISVNVTQNTYSILEYAHDSLSFLPKQGLYDDLLEAEIMTIPDSRQSGLIQDRLNRKSLLESYAGGEKTFNLRHKQVNRVNDEHWIDIRIVFVEPDKEGNIREVTLISNADENQGMLEDLHKMLRTESVYREAIMASSAGYMEIDFTTGCVEGDILNLSKDAPSHIITIPELEEPINYDQFENWWAEHMIVSDKEAFKKMSNKAYITSMFAKGNRYVEVPCRTKIFTDREYDCLQMYFLSQDETSGNIKGICILNDTSEQEQNKKEILQLTEELREIQIKNSLGQMQPHFLYNALASIREIIMENPQYASDLVYDFTTHLRACIKSMSNIDLIPFTQELDNTKAYVNIEKMRFGDKLKIEYDIECDDFMIVPLSIQPLVENSIRHGIYERGSKGGTIWLSTRKTENAYVICVKDDGVGFDYDKMKQEISKGTKDSTGLLSTSFRLEKILEADIAVTSIIGKGTEITITIPQTPKSEVI